jgi:hypothetical protein
MDSDCVPHHQLADCVGLRLIGSDYVPLIRYTHLKRLIYLLYKGDRDESDTSDAARAAEQAQQLHDECAEGYFERSGIDLSWPLMKLDGSLMTCDGSLMTCDGL